MWGGGIFPVAGARSDDRSAVVAPRARALLHSTITTSRNPPPPLTPHQTRRYPFNLHTHTHAPPSYLYIYTYIYIYAHTRMSQYGHGGYNGLKAFAFTVGVTVLIFALLYVTKRYNPRLFGRETFLRSHPWYLGGPIEPPTGRSDGGRRSLGEKPMMWDVWIASWYPPCPQRESRSEKEGEKSDPGCPAWAELLVSLSSLPLYPFRSLGFERSPSFPERLSHCLQIRYQTQTRQFPYLGCWDPVIPSSVALRLPKLESAPSFSCLPLLVPPLSLRLPHRTRPLMTPMTLQENTRLARPTSHPPLTPPDGMNDLYFHLPGAGCMLHPVGVALGLTKHLS